MNISGFLDMSSNKSLVYRVHEFPGLGFMIKMDMYENRMRGGLQLCCNSRYFIKHCLIAFFLFQ